MVNNQAARHFAEKIFHLGTEDLLSMQWEDHYKYLGCETGANPQAEMARVGRIYLDEVQKISVVFSQTGRNLTLFIDLLS